MCVCWVGVGICGCVGGGVVELVGVWVGVYVWVCGCVAGCGWVWHVWVCGYCVHVYMYVCVHVRM